MFCHKDYKLYLKHKSGYPRKGWNDIQRSDNFFFNKQITTSEKYLFKAEKSLAVEMERVCTELSISGMIK